MMFSLAPNYETDELANKHRADDFSRASGLRSDGVVAIAQDRDRCESIQAQPTSW